MVKKEAQKFYPKSRKAWREWLNKNHQSQQSVWLIYYRSSTQKPSITWSEAVDEAICFGWIDSTKKSIDQERYMQYFSKRKPSSTWSKINKEKVSILIQRKLMTPAGQATIDASKQNGNWSLMDDVENLIVPNDLKQALNKYDKAMVFFDSQSKSIRKGMLHWVVSAKRPETRKKRIAEIAQMAAKEMRPKQFR